MAKSYRFFIIISWSLRAGKKKISAYRVILQSGISPQLIVM